MLNGDNLFALIDIGASKLEPTFNTITVQGKGPQQSEDPEDSESFDDTPMFGALGLIARPYPKDSRGKCQGLLIRDASYGAVVGMRDNRTNDVYGNLEPGDVCLFATGPKHKARVIIKEETDTVVILGKDSNGKDTMLSSGQDGISLQAFGGIIQITEDGIVIGFKNNQIVLDQHSVTIGGKKTILGCGAPTNGVAMGVPGSPGTAYVASSSVICTL